MICKLLNNDRMHRGFLYSVWQCSMETDVSVHKQSFGDTFLAGVRQHLEAVGRNLDVCEMLEIG